MALTKHPQGSIRELWSISFPLMLSSLSFLSILFVDRIFLTNYSTEAMTAAVHASTSGWVFVFAAIVLASISEVFVAQYYGAKDYQRIGEPVWQMIWFALGTSLLFIPVGYWGGFWLFGYGAEKQLAREYFNWMLYFGPAFALSAALTGFYIGRGKTHLVSLLAIGTNALNVLFDWLLIFGVEGWIPPMGTKGAAIATSIGAVLQALILMILFLRKTNRLHFGTGKWRLHRETMRNCLRIGFPNALFYGLEGIGWAYFYHMMDAKGVIYITVASICQNMNVLFYFFGEGINKAVIAIIGYLIGSNAFHRVGEVIWNGVILVVGFFAILVIVVSFGHDQLITLFLPHATPEQLASWHDPIVLGFYASVFYILFEGLRLLLTGVLTATGDTLFLLIGGTLMTWLGFMLPVYLLLIHFDSSVEISIFIIVFFGAISVALYTLRTYWMTAKEPTLVT